MEKNKIATLKRSFDEIAHTHVDDSDSVEYWYARELQKVLEYKDWRNFKKVIDKAVLSANNSISSDVICRHIQCL